jgi:hypothetical protein
MVFATSQIRSRGVGRARALLLRRLVRVADQDRDTLDVLIDKLRRRFVRPTPAEARPAVRRDSPGAR